MNSTAHAPETIGEAVNHLGVEERAGEDLVLVEFKGGKPSNAPYAKNKTKGIPPNLYITTGRLPPGSWSTTAGRAGDNVVSIFALVLDLDLKDLYGIEAEEIHPLPQAEIDKMIDELRERILDVCKKANILPNRLVYSGYGLQAWFDIAPGDQGRIEDLRVAYKALVGAMNALAGYQMADKQVSDAGSRMVRLPGSANTKGETPRQVRIIHEDGGCWTVNDLQHAIARAMPREFSQPKATPKPFLTSSGDLSPADEGEIISLIRPIWTSGNRHALALGSAGWLKKQGVSESQATRIIDAVAGDDPERADRLKAVGTTYRRADGAVAGWTMLQEILPPSITDRMSAISANHWRSQQPKGREEDIDLGGSSENETSSSPKESGDVILSDIEAFLGRYVAYPSDHARVAHTLWIAHTHLMEIWDSTPRIAFLSPEPASGKTRALEVSELLVPRPVETVNVSAAYIFRKVDDPDGTPTILYDEIDTIFGPKAREHEDVRGLINAGHRKGAVAGRCVMRGKNVETVEYPAYCAVAMAGLGDLPDTIITRSIAIRMRRRARSERVEPFRRRVAILEGHPLRDRIAAWARSVSPTLVSVWPDMPAGIEDRDADVWEAPLAVADAAGGAWPKRARVAAVALVAQSKESTPSLGIRLLDDLRTVFGDRDAAATDTILTALHELPEAPWAEIVAGKPLNSRGLAKRLAGYDIKSKSVRVGERVVRGYAREDLADAWERYLLPAKSRESEDEAATSQEPVGDASSSPEESATSATSATASGDKGAPDAFVADVADFRGDEDSRSPGMFAGLDDAESQDCSPLPEARREIATPPSERAPHLRIVQPAEPTLPEPAPRDVAAMVDALRKESLDELRAYRAEVDAAPETFESCEIAALHIVERERARELEGVA